MKLKKEIDGATVKDIRNLFRLKEYSKANKGRTIRDIRYPFKYEEEDYCNNKADEVIEKLFKAALHRYQIGLETSMRGKEFIFDCVVYCVINVIK